MHPHSGTLASDCVRHIDSTELMSETPSNICSEKLRELRRKPEILILVLQLLHSKLLHGSRAALRRWPRVPKASILHDQYQGIFVFSLWLSLHFCLRVFPTETRLSADLQRAAIWEKEKENLWIHCGELKVQHGYKEQELHSQRTIAYPFDKTYFIVI